MKYKTQKEEQPTETEENNNDSILSDDSEKNDELFSIKDISKIY